MNRIITAILVLLLFCSAASAVPIGYYENGRKSIMKKSHVSLSVTEKHYIFKMGTNQIRWGAKIFIPVKEVKSDDCSGEAFVEELSHEYATYTGSEPTKTKLISFSILPTPLEEETFTYWMHLKDPETGITVFSTNKLYRK